MTPEPDNRPKKLNAYLKYSGMALQFFALIAIGAWIGQMLDEHFKTPKPYFTVLLILLLAGGYFYKMYRDLNA